jgi:CRISPR-associated protein Csb2
LVAAAHLGFRRTESLDTKQAALRWLEQLPAPEIIVPPAEPASVVRLYVPNNDMDKVAAAWARHSEPEKQPSELRTGKDLRPHVLGGDATVRFLWPIAEDAFETARSQAEVICAEARHLHCLGLGIDLVAGNGRILTGEEKQSLPGEVYVAHVDGMGSRVPAAGSFDELVARHASQAERVQAASGRGVARSVAPPAPPVTYREVGYRPRSAPHGREIYAFDLVDTDGEARSFDPRDAIEVAAWLRHAAHEIAVRLGLDRDFVERFVCGHGTDAGEKNNRFAYLALPTIGHRHADGRIRRVLVAEPLQGGGSKALAVARRLAGAALVREGTGEVVADLRAVSLPLQDGVTWRYLRAARRWGSVTPMILPGRDDRRSRKAVGLVIKALAQGGMTTPVEEVHLQPEPVFPGAEMAGRYRVPAYLTEFPRTHAIITFAEPISGPVSIGSGRHVGLGVLAGIHGEPTNS